MYPDMIPFLGLEAAEGRRRWRLPVQAGVCGKRSMLYGACALAAAIEVAEAAAGRPLVWASCHFGRPAPLGTTVDLHVELTAVGRAVSHGRVVGRLGDDEVFATGLALGARTFEVQRQWSPCPVVPSPETVPPFVDRASAGMFRGRIEERWLPVRPAQDADGSEATVAAGRVMGWLRLPDGVPARASALAALGDVVAVAAGLALGREVAAPSLDNSLRIVRPMETEWILADVHLHAVDQGFVHGTVHLWSAEGRLLAIAAQTGAIRLRHP
ncbi:MAG: thioesterase family protein [Actinomycetota bacterium]